MNFDDYLETWKETATSNMSEREAANIKQASSRLEGPGGVPIPVSFDPFALTRASSVGIRQSPTKTAPQPDASPHRATDSRPIESHATDASDDNRENRNMTVDQKYDDAVISREAVLEQGRSAIVTS